jgi:hypothetical protein
MASTAKRIEVRSADGSLMFTLRITDEPQGGGSRAPARNNRSNRSTSQKNQNGNNNGNGDNDGDAITDAQKRYLFRILADQGFQGDQALEHLKESFGVEDVNSVTKREASTLIEDLLASAPAT